MRKRFNTTTGRNDEIRKFGSQLLFLRAVQLLVLKKRNNLQKRRKN
jgi:hypothetical protein